MKTLFDSRNEFFRSPFGAVSRNTPIHFKIRLPRYLCCTGASLLVMSDDPSKNVHNDMFWCGTDSDFYEFWECHFTPVTSGVYWYVFQLSLKDGINYLGRSSASRAVLTSSPEKWQITVYDEDYVTPDWLDGGVIYQIFPDRFAESEEVHENVPSDRIIHENWSDQPLFRPDGNGKILNNDYFGGDLKGIERKLPYIASLGVTCIYLNPIFEAHENHRYNTADYSKIDPMLGTTADFSSLCEAAGKLGIKILLDGVFSHTGIDSVYFNKFGRYASSGAYNSESSPYYEWYKWQKWPEKYTSWWGISTLPEINEDSPSFIDYIAGKDGILRKWIRAGASGWRLDVADELPDVFLDALRKSVKDEDPDALILGEVWEDATSKIAYGQRRRYLEGRQLDSVMNYPFKNAVINYIRNGRAQDSLESILDILENYPPQAMRLLMNPISTHDTERAITAISGIPAGAHDREWQSRSFLSPDDYEIGVEKLKLAALLQYTLPGVPSLYYGDEAGMQGYRDPFNRGCYPWGSENADLIEWFRMLGKMRKAFPCLRGTAFYSNYCQDDIFSFVRTGQSDKLFVAVNRGECSSSVAVPDEFRDAEVVLGDSNGYLDPLDCCVLYKSNPATSISSSDE